jgi:hypothetical protein
MQYRRLENGEHVVGFKFEGRFIIYSSVFDEREGKALVKTIRAVFDLFHATSGAWVTMRGTTEIPRGATTKIKMKAKKKRTKIST